MSDLIDRQAAIDALQKEINKAIPPFSDVVGSIRCGVRLARNIIEDLPSAQPEMNFDEWCTDCKEYDHERHCCPRWNRVIRQTLKDMKEEQPEIIRCKDCKYQVNEWRADKRLKDKGYMVCGCEVVGDACGYWALLGRDDDYCSMAERRTDVDVES